MATTSVFLVPGLFVHIRQSVIDGVDLASLTVNDAWLRAELGRRYEGVRLHLWGTKETLRSRWEAARSGDWLLFYHEGRFPYVGRVELTYPTAESDLQLAVAARVAEQVWGKDPSDGRTWPRLLFLRDVREVEIPLHRVNELTGYRFSAVGGFMRVADERSGQLLAFLESLLRPARPPTRAATPHERVVQSVYELGEIIGYKPAKGWRYDRFTYDVVWHKPPRVGPKCVFEIHDRGDLGEALLRLKHTHDLWESQLFLVASEKDLHMAQTKYLGGALHELAEAGSLAFVRMEEIEEFFRFKGRYEWLERKMGLRPR